MLTVATTAGLFSVVAPNTAMLSSVDTSGHGFRPKQRLLTKPLLYTDFGCPCAVLCRGVILDQHKPRLVVDPRVRYSGNVQKRTVTALGACLGVVLHCCMDNTYRESSGVAHFLSCKGLALLSYKAFFPLWAVPPLALHPCLCTRR